MLATSAAAQTQPQEPTPLPNASEGDAFTLNLKDADITTLIATVSEVTGRNFVVDPRVKGDVTVLSNEPMTPEQLYETFLSVLDVHGFAAVPSGEVIKIIPQINAKQDGGFGNAGGTREDIVTRVLHVNNVPADQLVPILRPLVPQYGHLAAYSASNTLIISDREANTQRLAEIVAKIDRNGVQNTETIRLQYANADEVAKVVDQLKAGDGGQSAGGFTIIPDTRTNSVIINGGKQERLRLRAIIADLDTETEQTGGTQVIYLDYADADALAPVLQNFANGQGATGGGTSSAGGSTTASGGAGATTPVSTGGGNDNGVTVISEPAANALVVTAPADTMRQIRKVIEQLDIRRGQVLVEAIIAEVSLSRSRDLGVNVAAFSGNTPAAASILDQNTLDSVGPAIQNGTPLNLIQQGLNIALGDVGGDTGFALLVNALSSNTNTNVLSTPSLITRDNEEAEIKVGQEVPFVTGSYSNSNSGGGGLTGVNPFNTVERKDVGLTLGFTPQISAGDTIQLTIDQEISSIAQNASNQTGAVDLITNNRTLTTSVEVDNGQILVLGGLIDDQVTESQSKVPLLGDIPLIGALFRNRSVQKNKRNLLNFIRPTILRGGGEANYYTRKKYDYIRSLQQRQAESSIPLMGEEQRPQLPPIEQYDGSDSFSKDSGINGDRVPGDAGRNDNGNGGKRRGDQY